MIVLVFAYGTLMNAERRAAVIGALTRCRIVGAGRVPGVLFDVGEYPALCAAHAPNDVVPGLVLELDDAALPLLDAYEGTAEGLYVREQCEVQLDDGGPAAAWVYVYRRPTAGLRRIAAWPPNG